MIIYEKCHYYFCRINETRFPRWRPKLAPSCPVNLDLHSEHPEPIPKTLHYENFFALACGLLREPKDIIVSTLIFLSNCNNYKSAVQGR